MFLEIYLSFGLAQCAHGAVSAFGHASKDSQYANLAEEWFVSGQKKIVVRVDDLETLQSLHRKARELGLPRHIVVDAGRTQVAPSTPTVLAIGPASATEIDKITGNCKLYS